MTLKDGIIALFLVAPGQGIDEDLGVDGIWQVHYFLVNLRHSRGAAAVPGVAELDLVGNNNGHWH
jgi:hypothetical protein